METTMIYLQNVANINGKSMKEIEKNKQIQIIDNLGNIKNGNTITKLVMTI